MKKRNLWIKKIQKTKESYWVLLPKKLCQKIDLRKGSLIKISERKESLIIEKK